MKKKPYQGFAGSHLMQLSKTRFGYPDSQSEPDAPGVPQTGWNSCEKTPVSGR